MAPTLRAKVTEGNHAEGDLHMEGRVTVNVDMGPRIVSRFSEGYYSLREEMITLDRIPLGAW